MALISLPRIAFRTLVAIFCANFATMLVMNIFKLAANMQPWIYVPLLAIFLWATRLVAPRVMRITELLPRREATWVVCGVLIMGLLFPSIRFQYPFEPLMHRLALGLEVDASHTQELSGWWNGCNVVHIDGKLVSGHLFDRHS